MQYQLIRSNRKTLAIEITLQGQLLVRCPNRMPLRDIEAFLESTRDWIEKHMESIEARPQEPPFTEAELHQMADMLIPILQARLPRFAQLLGVTFKKVTVRNQTTLWGSCSSDGNLNFNCLLAAAPAEVQNYVMVHELCHLLEMNHSPAFWANVEQIIPDYKRHRKWLKDNGGSLIRRLPNY